MTQSWPGPAPNEITAWLLVQVGHSVGNRFRQALAEQGLTPTQFGVLLELYLHPGMANAEVARAILVTPQSMSDLLASLSDLGYIDRNPAAGKGRRVPAQLTDAGHEILRRCHTAVGEVQASLQLGVTQTAQLNDLLHHVLAAAKPSQT